jgi:glycosyltransferase involved in cell wall biosynthesis
MAVANPITTDTRVRKAASSVAAMGYRVTLLWADDVGHVVTEGELDGARTIGLPVRYELREETLRRLSKRATPGRDWLRAGYRDARARRVKAAELAARRSRLDTDRLPASLRAAQFTHRLRSKLLSVRLDGHQRRYEAWRRRQPWRRELANVADLDGVFVPWMIKLEPDLLHLHDVHLLEAGIQAKRRLAAQGKAVKVVYDAHEYVAGMHGGNPFWEAAYTAMEREFAAQADAFVTVSEPIADLLPQDLGLATRPTVVLNTPLLGAGQGQADGPDLRSVLGLSPQTALGVYAGVLHANRNLRPLIESVALVPDLHLALVCVPNAHYWAAEALRRHAADLGLDDRVHLVEPVAPEQVVRFLSSATFGVHPMAQGLPNHEMALPNKLFDYIWAGLPVAVSRVKAMAELVEEAGIGFAFDPDDPASIAQAISQVLDHRKELAAAARAPELKERFAWEGQAAKLGRLYDQLAPLAAP